jgi:AraC-like DNA-binding protein
MEEIKQVLIDNITNPEFELKQALGSFGTPYITLHKQFKKSTGITPLQYLIDLRIRESCKLLGIPAEPASRNRLPYKEGMSVRGTALRSVASMPLHARVAIP